MTRHTVVFASTVSTLEGGAERSLLELARALPDHGWTPLLAAWSTGPLPDAFRAAGFEVRTLASGRCTDVARPLGGATAAVPGLSTLTAAAMDGWVSVRPLTREAKWLAGVARAAGAALLVSNCDLSTPTVGFAARRAGLPHAAFIRDLWRRWTHPRVLRALRRAEATMVQSRFMRDRFRRAGLDPHVLPSPVDPSELAREMDSAERATLREALGIRGELAVACVGRLDEQKRPDIAIRAVARMAEAGTNAVLLCAGDGPPALRRRLEADANRCAPGRVRFLGHRTDVEQWLPATDAMVVPAEGEPFGRMIVEGMLAGRPVVAARDGAAPEILRDGVTGVLVHPGDTEGFAAALSGLFADPSRAAVMGAVARADAVARFAPQAVARRAAALFRSSVEGTT